MNEQRPMIDLGYVMGRLEGKGLRIFAPLDTADDNGVIPTQEIYVVRTKQLRDFLNEHITD